MTAFGAGSASNVSPGMAEGRLPVEGYTYRTPEAIAREKKDTAVQRACAGLWAARQVMAREGCTWPAGEQDHDAHMTAVREVLMELGVLPDPESRPMRNSKGFTQKPKRAAS